MHNCNAYIWYLPCLSLTRDNFAVLSPSLAAPSLVRQHCNWGSSKNIEWNISFIYTQFCYCCCCSSFSCSVRESVLSQVYFGLHEIGQLELQGVARGLRMWMWPNGHAQTCASRVWHIAYCMACTECGISRIRHVALACAGSSAQLRSLFLPLSLSSCHSCFPSVATVCSSCITFGALDFDFGTSKPIWQSAARAAVLFVVACSCSCSWLCLFHTSPPPCCLAAVGSKHS